MHHAARRFMQILLGPSCVSYFQPPGPAHAPLKLPPLALSLSKFKLCLKFANKLCQILSQRTRARCGVIKLCRNIVTKFSDRKLCWQTIFACTHCAQWARTVGTVGGRHRLVNRKQKVHSVCKWFGQSTATKAVLERRGGVVRGYAAARNQHTHTHSHIFTYTHTDTHSDRRLQFGVW